VAILLTLFHLGIKNIRLGPSLPAFITPNVLDVLVKNFDIKPITTPDEDLKAILGPACFLPRLEAWAPAWFTEG
jgi:hydroxylamine reductase